jgi:HlyD family secretion protein/epimerase transport system membrane fusion protein
MVSLLPGQAGPAIAGELSPPTFPTNYRKSIVFGWAVIIAAFGSLVLWSALAPLSSAAIAPGTVVVDSSRKEIEHLEGGIVKEILVRDGDVVRAGQVLLRLDDTQVRATLDLLQGRYDADRAYEARLLAERDDLPEIVFPDELLQRAAADHTVASILEGQRRIFEARRNSLSGEISILENRIEQSRAQIHGLETQVGAKERQIALLQKELDGLKTLLKKGHASEMQVLAVEREYERLKGERGEILANIAGVRQAIGEAGLQIVQLKKTFREQVENELRDVQTQIFDVSQKIYASRDQLNRLDVQAPTSGIVVDLAAHTVGGVIAPGSRILDIVPEDDQLVIDAQVRPDDVDGLKTGAPADIRFTAFNQNTMPVVSGVVTRVSADRLLDPNTRMPYFLVRVAVDENGRSALKDAQLVPGMSAEVIIKKGEQTLLGYLMGPLRDIMMKAFRQ